MLDQRYVVLFQLIKNKKFFRQPSKKITDFLVIEPGGFDKYVKERLIVLKGINLSIIFLTEKTSLKSVAKTATQSESIH